MLILCFPDMGFCHFFNFYSKLLKSKRPYVFVLVYIYVCVYIYIFLKFNCGRHTPIHIFTSILVCMCLVFSMVLKRMWALFPGA